VREPDEAISSLDVTTRVPLAAMVTLIPASQCSDLWHDHLLGNGISADGLQVDNRHLFTHDPEHQRDTCQGDSGRPLLINIDGEWQLAGLTSFGLGRGSVTGVPTVYTKVSEYTDWIERTTQTIRCRRPMVVVVRVLFCCCRYLLLWCLSGVPVVVENLLQFRRKFKEIAVFLKKMTYCNRSL